MSLKSVGLLLVCLPVGLLDDDDDDDGDGDGDGDDGDGGMT